MSVPRLESFLARAYADAEVAARVAADPEGEARRAGLADEHVAAVARMDLASFDLAVQGFAAKRRQAGRAAPWWRRVFRRR